FVRRSIVFFFFFQAEDGIRDFHVTGVQTCALPISLVPASTGPRRSRDPRLVARRRRRPSAPADPGEGTRPRGTGDAARGRGPRRSEERRVGKEGRCRWAPAQ